MEIENLHKEIPQLKMQLVLNEELASQEIGGESPLFVNEILIHSCNHLLTFTDKDQQLTETQQRLQSRERKYQEREQELQRQIEDGQQREQQLEKAKTSIEINLQREMKEKEQIQQYLQQERDEQVQKFKENTTHKAILEAHNDQLQKELLEERRLTSRLMKQKEVKTADTVSEKDEEIKSLKNKLDEEKEEEKKLRQVLQEKVESLQQQLQQFIIPQSGMCLCVYW